MPGSALTQWRGYPTPERSNDIIFIEKKKTDKISNLKKKKIGAAAREGKLVGRLQGLLRDKLNIICGVRNESKRINGQEGFFGFPP